MSSPAEFSAAVKALAAALLASCVDPADGIRLLIALSDFYPKKYLPASMTGQAMATMQSAIGDLGRRTAVIALARASTLYQPSSYDDAVAIRSLVCDRIEVEITIAGDQGEDESHAALKALRQAVMRDLTRRGGDLAPIKTYITRQPMPAMALALRFYRDAARGDELVTQVDPIHPAFMPTRFQALAG